MGLQSVEMAKLRDYVQHPLRVGSLHVRPTTRSDPAPQVQAAQEQPEVPRHFSHDHNPPLVRTHRWQHVRLQPRGKNVIQRQT